MISLFAVGILAIIVFWLIGKHGQNRVEREVMRNLFSITVLTLAVLALLACGCEKPVPQSEVEPTLISTKDGVRLWKVRDVEYGQWVYFTTPKGDVNWEEQVGKHREQRSTSSGQR